MTTHSYFPARNPFAPGTVYRVHYSDNSIYWANSTTVFAHSWHALNYSLLAWNPQSCYTTGFIIINLLNCKSLANTHWRTPGRGLYHWVSAGHKYIAQPLRSKFTVNCNKYPWRAFRKWQKLLTSMPILWLFIFLSISPYLQFQSQQATENAHHCTVEEQENFRDRLKRWCLNMLSTCTPVYSLAHLTNHFVIISTALLPSEIP